MLCIITDDACTITTAKVIIVKTSKFTSCCRGVGLQLNVTDQYVTWTVSTLVVVLYQTMSWLYIIRFPLDNKLDNCSHVSLTKITNGSRMALVLYAVEQVYAAYVTH